MSDNERTSGFSCVTTEWFKRGGQRQCVGLCLRCTVRKEELESCWQETTDGELRTVHFVYI